MQEKCRSTKLISSFVMAAVLATGLALLASRVSADEASVVPEGARVATQNSPELRPLYHVVEKNSYSGGEFRFSEVLYRNYGKKVNFWVNNTGTVNVRISINNDYERILKPGESGHISARVSHFPKKYTFRAEATPNGGRVSINYGIVQRRPVN